MTLNSDDLEMIKMRILDKSALQGTQQIAYASTSVWIASGLAKISAVYGASLFERYSERPSRMMTPLEYCHNSFLQALPIVVSLKGQNEDAINVAKVIVERQIIDSIIITGEPEGLTSQILRKNGRCSLVTSKYPKRDKRFVNCNSVFMLSSLSYRLVAQAFGELSSEKIIEEQLELSFYRAMKESYRLTKDITNEHLSGRQLIILGLGLELGLPWQSIFSESGIANPIFLDIKDYTHGDHLATLRVDNAIFLVIERPGIREICKIFVSRFSTRYIVKLISLELEGPIQFWENLFYCCNFAGEFTKILGYGDQRPPKDQVANKWRGWGSVMTR